MTSVENNLPDDQTAALETKATAEGLSLESWFRKVASQEVSVSAQRLPKKSAYGPLAEYGPGPSEQEIDANRRAAPGLR